MNAMVAGQLDAGADARYARAAQRQETLGGQAVLRITLTGGDR